MELSKDISSDAKILFSKLLEEHAFVLSATRHEVNWFLSPLLGFNDEVVLFSFRWDLDSLPRLIT